MNRFTKALVVTGTLLGSMNAMASTGGGHIIGCHGEGKWDGTRDSAVDAIYGFCYAHNFDRLGANSSWQRNQSGWFIHWENHTNSPFSLNLQDCFDIAFTVLDGCQAGSYMKRGGAFQNGNSSMILERR